MASRFEPIPQNLGGDESDSKPPSVNGVPRVPKDVEEPGESTLDAFCETLAAELAEIRQEIGDLTAAVRDFEAQTEGWKSAKTWRHKARVERDKSDVLRARIAELESML